MHVMLLGATQITSLSVYSYIPCEGNIVVV